MVAPTTALFEGGRHAGVHVSVIVDRTRPGGFVEMHTHPYSETFLLIEGRARWTVGETVNELGAGSLLVVPALAPHGFRNVGCTPVLLVAVHESGVLTQTSLGVEPR
jgi:quercetin dioxygenase-like cupin family protein